MLAERLNMTSEKAEEWIVNLIRNARLDAAIDSKEGHVVMATQVPSVYQQVIEKTKSLSFRRCFLLSLSLSPSFPSFPSPSLLFCTYALFSFCSQAISDLIQKRSKRGSRRDGQ